MESAKQEHLLEEYRLAHEYVLSTHQRIWQIGGVLVAASLASFAIVAAQQPISMTTLIVSVIAGFVSSSLMVIWFQIRERFASFIQVTYYRMREIEDELGLWRNKYIHYLDNPLHFQVNDLSNLERDRLRLLRQYFKTTHFKRRRAFTLELSLVLLVGLTWIAWIAYLAALLL